MKKRFTLKITAPIPLSYFGLVQVLRMSLLFFGLRIPKSDQYLCGGILEWIEIKVD
jgi:hypothetical protein